MTPREEFAARVVAWLLIAVAAAGFVALAAWALHYEPHSA